MAHILSKTTYLYGLQCTKRLFLHKYRKELRNATPDLVQQEILNSGTSIGELARKLFNYGADATPPDHYSYHIAVAKTKAFINQGVDTIYEAAFEHNGVMCAVDILVKNGKHWYAFEVKSGLSVKPEHVRDAALQYYVITNSGLPLEDISIVYLNRDYKRNGKLELKHLFNQTSVLDDVLEQQDFITRNIESLKTMLSERFEPAVEIGPHCAVPYGCDFTDHCWSHMMPIENTIFSFFSARTAWKLYHEGYRQLDDVPDDYALTETMTMKLVRHRSREVMIDKPALEEFLQTISYPVYYFDFETINPGVPEFDDSKPYQQIPFQFSLHVQREPGAELEHREYLGNGITDPRPALADAMVELISAQGSIICYNISFEKRCIVELARLYPQHAPSLLAIHERIIDLMIPFQRRYYYHPDFRGSYSIKNVLPVLVPELSYTNLIIQEGGSASLAYAQLKWQDEAEQHEQRKHLLAYCKLDTLAMARIHAFLRHCEAPQR